MQPLANLQADFADYLLAPPQRTATPSLADGVAPGGAPAEQRLAIYKNNVHSQLVDALAATFPAVERLVGQEFFRHAAREYAGIHPPRQPTLLRYGDRFPEFLGRFPPATTVPYLPDVARLELLYLEAYHAAEADSLDADQFIARLTAGDADAAFALHPSARLMQSNFPVSRIWELNRQADTLHGKTKIPGEAEHLLIIRPDATVEVRRLSPGTYAALSALIRGRALQDALAAGERAEPEIDLTLHLTSLAEGRTFSPTENQQ
jgi:hypothetical protein